VQILKTHFRIKYNSYNG